MQGLLRYAAARSTHVPVWLLLLLLVAAWGVLGAAWGLLQVGESVLRQAYAPCALRPSLPFNCSPHAHSPRIQAGP